MTGFYTIRVSNADTIRFTEYFLPIVNTYPILNDSYFDTLKNSPPADFRFIGEINDTIVIDEPYKISADDCHIFVISEKSEVQL